MQQLRLYLSPAVVAVAVLSYMALPSTYQEAAAALLSSIAAITILIDVFIHGKLPHPRYFFASQWIVIAFLLVLFILLGLSQDIRHALWGFSFDVTSVALFVAVFSLPLIVGGLPQKTRQALFAVGLLGLIALSLYPMVRNQIRVRPSSEVTIQIESSMYVQQGAPALLFGGGPNSFVYAWQTHRPQAVLSTPFWSDDFPTGSSVASTLLIETGVISVLLLTLMFVVAFVEEFLRGVVRGHGRIPRIKTFLSSLFVVGALCALLFGEPSAPLVLISGVLLATFRQTEAVAVTLSSVGRRALVVFGFFLLLCVLYIGVAVSLYFYSFSKVTAGDLTRARAAALNSYALTKDPQTGRLLSQILRSAGHELGRIQTSKEKVQRAFAEASVYARKSTEHEPLHAQNWKLLGISLAEQLSLDRKKEFLEEGDRAFNEAQKLSPLDASVPFFRAQLYILAGDRVKAAEALDAALLLRPSYTEARELREAIAQ